MVAISDHFSTDFLITSQALLPGIWIALMLDLLLGDPRRLPHPVMLIAALAKTLASFFTRQNMPLRRAGLFTVAATLFGISCAMIFTYVFLEKVSPFLLFICSVLFLYTTIALRSLVEHALAVYSTLPEDKKTAIDTMLDPARKKVGLIVGRDTSRLGYEDIVLACVESVAENMSDGVIAPVFYAFIGAALSVILGLDGWEVPAASIAAMLYKTVNTMDSMFGYKNTQYLEFGRAPALLDDMVNYVPARLSAFALIAVSFCIGKTKMLSAWTILFRDHNNHSSPNAGWPEAAMAGALNLQLGGSNIYFGELIEKPFIGDAGTQPGRHHIKTTLRLMIAGSFLVFMVLSIIYAGFF